MGLYNDSEIDFLETTAQSLEIENIIAKSVKYSIIVSPYLKINNRLKPKLTDCYNRNGKNLILFRDNELSKDDRKWLETFSNVILFPIKNLHAKCYLNENVALITSMNLYDYSQVNNHELGIKISRIKNKTAMLHLLDIINNIIKTDHPSFSFFDFIKAELCTMGTLYGDLIKEYDFPEKHNGIDGTYEYLCQIATKIHTFSPQDFKIDKSALKRATILDSKTYFYLKNELVKKGKHK